MAQPPGCLWSCMWVSGRFTENKNWPEAAKKHLRLMSFSASRDRAMRSEPSAPTAHPPQRGTVHPWVLRAALPSWPFSSHHCRDGNSHGKQKFSAPMTQPSTDSSLIFVCRCVMLPLFWQRKQKYHKKKHFLQYFWASQIQEIMEVTVMHRLFGFLVCFCISVISWVFHRNIWSHKQDKPAYVYTRVVTSPSTSLKC